MAGAVKAINKRSQLGPAKVHYPMIKWFQITFTAPVHVGERGIGVESVNKWVPSTTIHGAMINAMVLLGLVSGREVLQAAEELSVNTPSPLIGSTPYVWMIGLDILFAEEAGRTIGSIRDYHLFIKELKKVCLVSAGFIGDAVNGCRPGSSGDEYFIECGDRVYYLAKTRSGVGVLVSGEKRIPELLRIRSRPRNVIDRVTGAAEPYYQGIVRYRVPLLLGVGIKGETLSWRDIEATLRLLSDLGIGGERTYGFGRFIYEEKTVSIPIERGENICRGICQGLYSPADNPVYVYENSIYITGIHGHRGTLFGITRTPVVVLREGSIVSCNSTCRGKIVYEHIQGQPVIRSFNPLMIPLGGDDKDWLS